MFCVVVSIRDYFCHGVYNDELSIIHSIFPRRCETAGVRAQILTFFPLICLLFIPDFT